MSRQLLEYLNGNNTGLCRDFLDTLQDEPSIAWYPSAGMDFRALMHLSPEYAAYNPACIRETEFPDIFLLTDYRTWGRDLSPLTECISLQRRRRRREVKPEEEQYLPFVPKIKNPEKSELPCTSALKKSVCLYRDNHTAVWMEDLEFLSILDLALDPEIIDFPERHLYSGGAVFMYVRVLSDLLGTIRYPVIYVFAENEAFCSQVLLEQNSMISHIVHVRYGGGFGGGCASGSWMLQVLDKLGCRVFINDQHFFPQRGDEAALSLYPNLAGDVPAFTTIREIPGECWSNHGDVRWDVVEPG